MSEEGRRRRRGKERRVRRSEEFIRSICTTDSLYAQTRMAYVTNIWPFMLARFLMLVATFIAANLLSKRGLYNERAQNKTHFTNVSNRYSRKIYCNNHNLTINQ